MTEDHTHRGKWSQAGVPHKGWVCVGTEDLEEPSATCDMCESVEIRFVHFMEHEDYSETLAVGCVCAEHMQNDYVGPREREKRLRLTARRRRSWSERQWSISAKGNPYLNTEGFNLTVYSVNDRRGRYWGLRVSYRVTGATQAGKRRYASEEEAKRAALDALIWAKSNLRD